MRLISCGPLLAGLAVVVWGTVQAEIGDAARGGQPESLFIARVPAAQGQGTAELIAKALAKGRLVIFGHMGKLTDPKLGDKGFTGDYFMGHWKAALEPELMGLTPEQKPILEKLLWAGKQSIDNNQDRLNVKGVGWKNFLPAKCARETGDLLNTRTGIVTRQPSRAYRHPANRPDELDRKALVRATSAGFDGRPFGEFAMMGKQKVYRYYEPVPLMKPCLACHGEPKGERDILGYEKDGLKEGDVFGLISVAVPVTD